VVGEPNRSRHCFHAPRPSFPILSPLYPLFSFASFAVLFLTFRQSLHWLLCLWCSQMPLLPQSLHLLLRRWCSQRPLPPQTLHLLLTLWCSQRAGVLRGFLAAEGYCAEAVIRPDVLAGFTHRSSCMRHFPCGPLGPSSILFLSAAAASRPSV